MINIHCWEEEEPEDMHLECVVDILLSNFQGLTRDDDVRTKSWEVSTALKEAVAVHRHGEGELKDNKDLNEDSVPMHVADAADMSDQADDTLDAPSSATTSKMFSSPTYSRMQ